MTPADPLQEPGEPGPAGEGPRQRFVLDDQGFDEVPKKYRRFYRRWKGEGDSLGPNEALCPVCKIVVRSTSPRGSAAGSLAASGRSTAAGAAGVSGRTDGGGVALGGALDVWASALSTPVASASNRTTRARGFMTHLRGGVRSKHGASERAERTGAPGRKPA